MSKPKRKRHSSRLSSPDQHLRTVLSKYPDLHKMVLNLLQGKGKDIPDWPDYCLLPLSGWIAIATRGKTPDTVSVIGEANRLAAVGTWSYSRGIYEIDPDLTTELINTPLTGAIPSETLTRLPEWRPCLVVGIPVFLAILCLAVMPNARFQLKDNPGIPDFFAIVFLSFVGAQ